MLERFRAAVDADQARLLELPGFDLPQRLGLERPVPDERQRVGVIGLAALQALRGVDYPSQFVAMGTFAVALGLMALSLGCLVYEVWISGGALRILLNAVDGKDLPRGCDN